jgi:hypothetical protein
VICFGGPLSGKRITNPGKNERIYAYSTYSDDVTDLLTRNYHPLAVGYYEMHPAENLQWIAEWHELET